MKKILIGLFVTVFLTGCFSIDEVSETTEEIVLTPQDYYDIAIEKLDSDTEGSIKGHSTSGVIPGGVQVFDYNGTVTKGAVKFEGTKSTIEKSEFSLESNINNYTPELAEITNGIILLYTVYDDETCELSEKTLTCSASDIFESPIEGEQLSPSNTKYNGTSYTYVFTFDDNEELVRINISYAYVTDLVQPNQDGFIINHEISNFLQNPKMKYFTDMNVYGKMFFGYETIEYTK